MEHSALYPYFRVAIKLLSLVQTMPCLVFIYMETHIKDIYCMVWSKKMMVTVRNTIAARQWKNQSE